MEGESKSTGVDNKPTIMGLHHEKYCDILLKVWSAHPTPAPTGGSAHSMQSLCMDACGVLTLCTHLVQGRN